MSRTRPTILPQGRPHWLPLALSAALALVLPLTPAARADNPTGQVTAVCTAGEGCACYDGASPEDILLVWGAASTRVPDGWAGDVRSQTVVIEPGTGRVYRSAAPRGQINATYGGRDECEPAPRPDVPVPLDGTWQWRTLGQTVAGCPAMMAAALAAGTDIGPATRVAWNGAFDPARLTGSLPQAETTQVQPYVWRQLGPGRWLSDNLRESSCEDGICTDVALTLSMSLASAERITGLLTVTSRIGNPDPAAAAMLAALGMGDCRVRQRYEIRRVGP